MKNVQGRFSDEVYAGLKRIADEEGVSLSDVLKRGIQLYGILRAYQKEGKDLALVDQSGDLYARLIIPGITSKSPVKDSHVGQGGGEPDRPVAAGLTPFTPAREVSKNLQGVSWPDPDFANDVEVAMKEMRSQSLRKDLSWPE